jgi:hypothetical protein
MTGEENSGFRFSYHWAFLLPTLKESTAKGMPAFLIAIPADGDIEIFALKSGVPATQVGPAIARPSDMLISHQGAPILDHGVPSAVLGSDITQLDRAMN